MNCEGVSFLDSKSRSSVPDTAETVVRTPLKSTEFSRSQGDSDPIRNSAANCFGTQKSCLLKTRYFVVSRDALKQTHNLSHAGARAWT